MRPVLAAFHVGRASSPLQSHKLARAKYQAELERAPTQDIGVVVPKDDGRVYKSMRDDIKRQIAAEQFNPEATQQAFAAWRTALDRFFASFSGPLVEALSQVSAEARRKLVAEYRPLRPEPPAP